MSAILRNLLEHSGSSARNRPTRFSLEFHRSNAVRLSLPSGLKKPLRNTAPNFIGGSEVPEVARVDIFDR